MCIRDRYIFVARYLSKSRETEPNFKQSFIELWIPVGITLMLILPANFSTAALIFAMVVVLVFIGCLLYTSRCV